MNRRRQEYGTVVIVGGGCYGSWYLQQLLRARRAGAVVWRQVLVVDRNSACKAAPALERETAVGLVTSGWSEFFSDYLSRWEQGADAPPDTIVPSPLMPHLMYEWVRDRAIDRWPHRSVETLPLEGSAGTPWESAAPDGTRYVSFAEWMCPINCIEPELCPHTRTARDWTMPAAASAYVAARREAGQDVLGPLVFHCTHRVYGVGMIDTSAVVQADRTIGEAAANAPATFLVGTVSHCHGALNVLRVS